MRLQLDHPVHTDTSANYQKCQESRGIGVFRESSARFPEEGSERVARGEPNLSEVIFILLSGPGLSSLAPIKE